MSKPLRVACSTLVYIITVLVMTINANADIRLVKGIPGAASKNGTIKDFGYIEIFGKINQSDSKNILPLLKTAACGVK